MSKWLSNWKGDLFGGVTAGVVALPLALAFGVTSGLGAAAGLYGAAVLGMLAAIFGGTPSQISGPTGPMTVISAAVVAAHMIGPGQFDMAAIVLTFVLAGVFQIVLGVTRVGAYIRYMPYPVISGFMSGIGVIIIILQLFPFTGQSAPSSGPLDILIAIAQIASAPNMAALLLAAATVAIIYLPSKLFFGFPRSLAALILVSAVAEILALDVPRIGSIPEGLPKLIFPALTLSTIQLAVLPAVQLCLLGAIDSLLTSVVADNLTKTKHDSNRELIGQGIGNTAAALVGGLPGAGATMRTLVNVQAGGKTRLSGVVHGMVLGGILLGLGALASRIPLAVLAGILVTVGIAIIDYRGLRHLTKVPRVDAFVMLFVFGLTVFDDLITAVAVGVVLACLLFMKKMADEMALHAKIVPMRDYYADEADIPPEMLEHVYIKHIDGPMFFGFASEFQSLSRTLVSAKVVVMRLSGMPYIDQTGLYVLEDACRELKESGVRVMLCELGPNPTRSLRAIGVIPEIVPDSDVYETFDACVKAFLEDAKNGKHGSGQPGSGQTSVAVR
jgi:SulP family sulfate permease